MSDYVQQSFAGGMNLLANDTRLEQNQYRAGFNVRNRYDIIEPVLESQIDVALPQGIVQEMVTFGNYVIVFVSGNAYFRYYTDTGWQQIVGFQMSTTAIRYWTVMVPVAITNYARINQNIFFGTIPPGTSDASSTVSLTSNVNSVLGFGQGNNPGLLVQDNINQPRFIYLSTTGPTTRITQDYSQWAFTIVLATMIVSLDEREYVPIGNAMAWNDGILWITSPDGNTLYRSVSGRPLDFVINIDTDGQKGGDATTTSYSVGVGGIVCLRGMSDGTLFVAASNANFSLRKSDANGGLFGVGGTVFGEPMFDRRFLFNATCLSDRAILDSIGDTRFIDLTGVRSFNAVQQSGTNEGRNSPFTSDIQAAFGPKKNPVIQDANFAASILYDDYEFYAVSTIFGPALLVYDTINKCWSSIDIEQTDGKRIKILSKIELSIQRLYAITEDNQLYTLYIGPEYNRPKLRPISASPSLIKDERGYSVTPRGEIKLSELRCVFETITEDLLVVATPYVNNRLAGVPATPKEITYSAPITPSSEVMPDIDTMLANVLFSFPNCGQGWKAFTMIEWSGAGALTQFIYTFNDLTPLNPLLSQGNTR